MNARPWRSFAKFALLTAWLGLGCSGRVVDLDRPAAANTVDAGDAPVDVLTHAPQLIASNVLVDDLRLYWFDQNLDIWSCLKNACTSSLLRYGSAKSPTVDQWSPDFAVGGDHVYWATADGTIQTCARAGCGEKPVKIITDPALTYNGVSVLTADAEDVYWPSGGAIYRCAASGCGAVPELVAHASTELISVVGTNAYYTSYTDIQTVPADGSGPVTTLGSGELIGVGDGAMYWASDRTDIFSCQLADCEHTQNLILAADPDLMRVGISVHGAVLYWVMGVSGGPVHSCRISDCAATDRELVADIVSDHASNVSSYAVDSENIYWTNGMPFEGTGIRRMRLPTF